MKHINAGVNIDQIPIVIKINTPSTVKDNPEPSKADADVTMTIWYISTS